MKKKKKIEKKGKRRQTVFFLCVLLFPLKDCALKSNTRRIGNKVKLKKMGRKIL